MDDNELVILVDPYERFDNQDALDVALSLLGADATMDYEIIADEYPNHAGPLSEEDRARLPVNLPAPEALPSGIKNPFKRAPPPPPVAPTEAGRFKRVTLTAEQKRIFDACNKEDGLVLRRVRGEPYLMKAQWADNLTVPETVVKGTSFLHLRYRFLLDPGTDDRDHKSRILIEMDRRNEQIEGFTPVQLALHTLYLLAGVENDPYRENQSAPVAKLTNWVLETGSSLTEGERALILASNLKVRESSHDLDGERDPANRRHSRKTDLVCPMPAQANPFKRTDPPLFVRSNEDDKRLIVTKFTKLEKSYFLAHPAEAMSYGRVTISVVNITSMDAPVLPITRFTVVDPKDINIVYFRALLDANEGYPRMVVRIFHSVKTQGEDHQAVIRRTMEAVMLWLGAVLIESHDELNPSSRMTTTERNALNKALDTTVTAGARQYIGTISDTSSSSSSLSVENVVPIGAFFGEDQKPWRRKGDDESVHRIVMTPFTKVENAWYAGEGRTNRAKAHGLAFYILGTPYAILVHYARGSRQDTPRDLKLTIIAIEGRRLLVYWKLFLDPNQGEGVLVVYQAAQQGLMDTLNSSPLSMEDWNAGWYDHFYDYLVAWLPGCHPLGGKGTPGIAVTPPTSAGEDEIIYQSNAAIAHRRYRAPKEKAKRAAAHGMASASDVAFDPTVIGDGLLDKARRKAGKSPPFERYSGDRNDTVMETDFTQAELDMMDGKGSFPTGTYHVYFPQSAPITIDGHTYDWGILYYIASKPHKETKQVLDYQIKGNETNMLKRQRMYLRIMLDPKHKKAVVVKFFEDFATNVLDENLPGLIRSVIEDQTQAHQSQYIALHPFQWDSDAAKRKRREIASKVTDAMPARASNAMHASSLDGHHYLGSRVIGSHAAPVDMGPLPFSDGIRVHVRGLPAPDMPELPMGTRFATHYDPRTRVYTLNYHLEDLYRGMEQVMQEVEHVKALARFVNLEF